MRPALTRPALALLLGAALALPATAQTAAPAAKPAATKKAARPAPVKPILEQRAIDLLQGMSQRLGAARTMSFTAVASYEYPSKLGPPIVYTVRYDVALLRPNQLRIVVPGDGPAFEFTFDGKEMVAFAPNENLVAVAEAPPTLEGALKKAFDSAAIYFPFPDLLLADPYGAIAPGAIRAFVIGPAAMVGGVSGLVFTSAYIVYFKYGGGTPDTYWWGISPEGIGTLGMAINFVDMSIVSMTTPPPPAKVQELVEYIRTPGD